MSDFFFFFSCLRPGAPLTGPCYLTLRCVISSFFQPCLRLIILLQKVALRTSLRHHSSDNIPARFGERQTRARPGPSPLRSVMYMLEVVPVAAPAVLVYIVFLVLSLMFNHCVAVRALPDYCSQGLRPREHPPAPPHRM